MSFAAELNDFINGFEAGNKMVDRYDDKAYKQMRTKVLGLQGDLLGTKIRDANDPEMRKMNRALIGARTNYLGAMSDRLRNPGGGKNAPEMYDNGDNPVSLPDVTPPATDKTSALGLPLQDDTQGDNYEQTAAEGGRVMDQKEVDQMVDGARAMETPSALGAMERMHKQRMKAQGVDKSVKGYADGGTVEPDDTNEEDQSTPDNATVTEGSYGGFSAEAGRDAVIEAVRYGPQAYGLTQQPNTALPSPQRAQRVRAYMSGQGAPSPQLMQQVYAKVDPEHKLSESQRVMAAMSAVRQYYLRQGNVQKANNAVLGMLQQNRINYMHYSALSKAALHGGNLDAAAMFASKAYANVPTGKDMKIVNKNGRLVYTAIDDATGNIIRKGILTPQELGAAVTGFTPDQFDKTLMEMAGQSTKAQAPRGEKAADLKTRTGLINEATPVPADATTGEPGKPTPDVEDARSLAHGLLAQNKGIGAKDAVKMAQMMTDPSVPLPKKTEAEGGAFYQFKGGPKMFVSDDVLERMVEMRQMKSPAGDVPVGSSRAADDPMANPKDLGEMGANSGTSRKIEGSILPRRDNTQRIARQSADQFTAGQKQPAPAPDYQE
ncbi:MAG: hypothetical protein ACXVCT_10615 [Ktedonobacterales bacterium]